MYFIRKNPQMTTTIINTLYQDIAKATADFIMHLFHIAFYEHAPSVNRQYVLSPFSVKGYETFSLCTITVQAINKLVHRTNWKSWFINQVDTCINTVCAKNKMQFDKLIIFYSLFVEAFLEFYEFEAYRLNNKELQDKRKAILCYFNSIGLFSLEDLITSIGERIIGKIDLNVFPLCEISRVIVSQLDTDIIKPILYGMEFIQSDWLGVESLSEIIIEYINEENNWYRIFYCMY